MFELLIAFKYLIPRKKQLSVALISCMSVTVISLVVWLVLVFLSVTEGIERSWLQKLTTLNAPLRITPTPLYYSSYYYKIDALSSASGYQTKNIFQKANASVSDPYNPEEDGEIPFYFPPFDKKDPVKELFSILETVKSKHAGFAFQEFELGGALLRLQLLRPGFSPGESNQSYLTQASYLATLPEKSPHFQSLLIPPSQKDADHLAYLSQHATEHLRQDAPMLIEKREKTADFSKISALLKQASILPLEENLFEEGETGVLLSKGYRESGVLVGDRGYLAYSSTTAGSLQEHRLPIFVGGFYDPGILSVGNKCILVPPFVTETVNASSSSFNLDKTQSNGILVWFDEIDRASAIKQELSDSLERAGLSSYWKISTFKEYDFAKDLMQQFQSDKYLFTLVSIIILLVACCNIISLLVLLVNDKKREIGVLQAMGASKKSIAWIFGTCGMVMGILSSLVGILGALLTLHYIDSLVHALSFLQGQEVFNAAFFGKSLPKELSHNALLFILITTPLLSFGAGLIPALKACRLRPSTILRSE